MTSTWWETRSKSQAEGKQQQEGTALCALSWYEIQPEITFKNIKTWRTARNLLRIWKTFFINASAWSLGTAGKSRSDLPPQLQSKDLHFRSKTTGMKMTAEMPGFLEQQIHTRAQTSCTDLCCWLSPISTADIKNSPRVPNSPLPPCSRKLPENFSYPRSWTPEMKDTIQSKLCKETASMQYLHHKIQKEFYRRFTWDFIWTVKKLFQRTYHKRLLITLGTRWKT